MQDHRNNNSGTGVEAKMDPFRCIECQYETPWDFALKNHEKRHHAISEDRLKPFVCSNKLENYECRWCPFQTPLMRLLQSHVKDSRHFCNPEETIRIPESKIYECDQCKFNSNTLDSFVAHLQTQCGKFESPHCPVRLTTKQKRQRHNAKTSEKQFDLLLDFMTAHNTLISGKFNPGVGLQEVQQSWEELAEILNSCSVGPRKSVDGWKKTWNEYKCRTKKKAREIKLGHEATGGGEAKVKQLSERDERLLGLLSRITVDGLEGVELSNVNTSESRLAEVAPEDVNEAEVVLQSEGIATCSQPSQKRRHSLPGPSSTKRTKLPTAAERATAAYARAMVGRNVELANNTAAIRELASAIRQMAAAMRSMANSLLR